MRTPFFFRMVLAIPGRILRRDPLVHIADYLGGPKAIVVHIIEYVRREESARRSVVFAPTPLIPLDARLVHGG